MRTAPTSSAEPYDVAIIGAGVVGCAIARSFAIRGIRTVVVEKAADILEGASKGNSALLHTGFDEPVGSLEFQMNKSGYAIYRRIHERMNLPFERTGAVVVAWNEEQRAKLAAIAAQASANGVAASVLSREELREREPQLAGTALGAVLIADEGVIDPWSAPLGYLRQALLHGATVLRRIRAEGEAMLPALAGKTITASFAGLRPATEHRDFQLRADAASRFITVGGIRSTGLSAALGLGEWAASEGAEMLGARRDAPPDEDLDWPHMPNLAQARPRPFQAASESRIACHCEWVTEGEIRDALEAAPKPGTLGGLKRRTGARLGVCQGFGCSGAVSRLAPQLYSGTLAEAEE
jgi:L-2-hydroxyglutarate oxidase LhgO